MMIKKLNTFVIRGHTNTGKSLWTNLMLSICRPEVILKVNDNSNFHMQHLPFATCALFEEPYITPTNIETMKVLFEGGYMKTDVKHSDPEEIPRLPIFITTNNPLSTWISGSDYQALQSRFVEFVFNQQIEHIVPVKDWTISKPEKTVTIQHIYNHIQSYSDRIGERINAILQTYNDGGRRGGRDSDE